jgi:glycosyltransferase involved in cell wall biosynthesis
VKILYTVQRYGLQVVGGSEAAARLFAEHLAMRGHDVHVLTSCAQSYVDWANVYDPGIEQLNGVTVHRLPVVDVRHPDRFGPLHQWMMQGSRPSPSFVQGRWAKLMGPDLANYRTWMSQRTAEFDVAVFMTYLYSTTTHGLPVASGRLPTVLQPTAHDEPPIRLPIYDFIFRMPDAFLFFTPEERGLVQQRFGLDPQGETTGIGIELEEVGNPSPQLLSTFGIANCPYLVYVGRIDAIKGSRELFDFFVTYKRRNPSPLKLALIGESISALPADPDVVPIGFLSEADKKAVVRGATALVQPSRFESFSIVVCEAWAQRRPVVVHRDCPVLVGQIGRSGGGLWYGGFAEFEATVNYLIDEPASALAIGERGRRYVESRYDWARVLDGVERTLQLAIERFSRRTFSHRSN